MAILLDFFPSLVLASQSVARKRLLQEMGLEVSIEPTQCDESHQEGDPAKAVHLLAKRKLQAYLSTHAKVAVPILTCDTLVWCDGKLIGKPSCRQEAKEQLLLFSNKSQEVHSGWALWFNNRVYDGVDSATVLFKDLDEQQIERYLDLGEWEGAAGSYRIQERGKELVSKVEGDLNTVIGLPLLQISEILACDCAR
ncbi:Maf family protein [Sphaerochaeta sp. PS]|uniref:Maf family protein n=1 Tax=Sphaerochaeta sp. PS TaxID=3076336 RepID=UPI0028A35BC9|nr:Maf family protein [Sphaerochaeta sp. PS]MDT4762866.1 Maf family protein [Sphaerochaeta sp. PS]